MPQNFESKGSLVNDGHLNGTEIRMVAEEGNRRAAWNSAYNHDHPFDASFHRYFQFLLLPSSILRISVRLSLTRSMGAAASFLPAYLYSQFIYRPKYPEADLSGQTIIVTGSNVGLGFDAAQHFVRLKASKVILAVRSETKGEEAKQKILGVLGAEADQSRLEVWILDLSSTASVTAFADRANRLDRLDAVVENAGILTTNLQFIDGVESQVKINVLSTVLLALSVLPKLQETGKLHQKETHLVLVGTNLRLIATFREKDVKGEKLFDIFHSKQDANNYDRYDGENNPTRIQAGFSSNLDSIDIQRQRSCSC